MLALGLCVSTVNFLKQKEFAFAVICLGILFILLAGFLNSLLEEEGFMELKEGESVNGFWIEDESFRPFDFSLSLKDFSVEFYPGQKKGMRFVKSYKSAVAISKDGNLLKEAVIEVNKPLNFGGYSFYQYGYDAELPKATVLQAVKDPALPFVYAGYAALLIGMFLSFKRVWKTI